MRPGPLAVEAGGGVDEGAKDSREEGSHGQLSQQLGQEVGPHVVALLAALTGDDGALCREGGAGLHQGTHGCVDGCHLHPQALVKIHQQEKLFCSLSDFCCQQRRFV